MQNLVFIKTKEPIDSVFGDLISPAPINPEAFDTLALAYLEDESRDMPVGAIVRHKGIRRCTILALAGDDVLHVGTTFANYEASVQGLRDYYAQLCKLAERVSKSTSPVSKFAKPYDGFCTEINPSVRIPLPFGVIRINGYYHEHKVWLTKDVDMDSVLDLFPEQTLVWVGSLNGYYYWYDDASDTSPVVGKRLTELEKAVAKMEKAFNAKRLRDLMTEKKNLETRLKAVNSSIESLK